MFVLRKLYLQLYILYILYKRPDLYNIVQYCTICTMFCTIRSKSSLNHSKSWAAACCFPQRIPAVSVLACYSYSYLLGNINLWTFNHDASQPSPPPQPSPTQCRRGRHCVGTRSHRRRRRRHRLRRRRSHSQHHSHCTTAATAVAATAATAAADGLMIRSAKSRLVGRDLLSLS